MKRLIFAISVLAASCAAGAVNSGSQVIPKPLSEQFTSDKAFVLTPKSVIAADTQLASQADYLALALGAPTGWDLPVKIGLKKGAIVLTVDTVAAPRAEGYRLSVTPKGVTIAAHDPAGAFYGIQTLLQYFPSEVYSPTRQKGIDWSVPSVVVDDAPDYPFRAMMLDAARYYYEPEYVKRFIDIMAAYKLNKLQFHFIDDCGWRMESKKYPLLTEVGAWAGEGADRLGGFYSRQDIADIIEYAAVRGVEVIPEIEFPAHFLAAIVAYPWLGCTGEIHSVPRQHFISRDLICPGKETSLTFLRDILDETVELFPSPYINIGGDEAVYSRWEECPDCQALMKREGLAKASELQGWLTNKVAGWMKERGRKVIGWEEIVLRGDVETPVTALVWHDPADSTSVSRGGRHKVILTPASHLYFDFPESGLPGEPKHATWMPPVSVEKAYTMPLEDYSPDGCVIGVQGSMWSDQFIHGTLLQDIPALNENRSMQYVEHFVMPRMLALSELAWTPQSKREWADFSDRMGSHFNRLEAMGVNYRVPVPEVESRTVNPDGTVTFALTPNVDGATIRYTTDGTWPTRHSAVYSGPVTVDKSYKFMAINMMSPRHYSLPLMEVRDYSEYSDLGAFTDEWTPKQVPTTPAKMRTDCTGKISGNGRFIVTFVPESGADRLQTATLELYKRDELIARVERPEFVAGATYEVEVDCFEAGTPFSLVYDAVSTGGTDSQGLIFVRKAD